MSKKKTEWRDVEGFPGFMVGTNGVVRSCWERYWEEGFKGSKSRMTDRWHDLNPAHNRGGYCIVTLRNGRRQKTGRVASLVLEAFRGPRPKGHIAAHYPDKNKNNNALSNLMWATHQTNSDHMKEHGTVLCGQKNPRTRLTNKQVYRMRVDRKNGMTLVALAEKYHVSKSAVGYAVNGDTWKRVPMP